VVALPLGARAQQPGAEPGKRVTNAGSHTESRKGKEEGEAHRTPSHQEAFYELKENAAPGVDRLTWKDYEAGLERKLEDLHDLRRSDVSDQPSPCGTGSAPSS
jgi:hypothetical protein